MSWTFQKLATLSRLVIVAVRVAASWELPLREFAPWELPQPSRPHPPALGVFNWESVMAQAEFRSTTRCGGGRSLQRVGRHRVAPGAAVPRRHARVPIVRCGRIRAAGNSRVFGASGCTGFAVPPRGSRLRCFGCVAPPGLVGHQGFGEEFGEPYLLGRSRTRGGRCGLLVTGRFGDLRGWCGGLRFGCGQFRCRDARFGCWWFGCWWLRHWEARFGRPVLPVAAEHLGRWRGLRGGRRGRVVRVGVPGSTAAGSGFPGQLEAGADLGKRPTARSATAFVLLRFGCRGFGRVR